MQVSRVLDLIKDRRNIIGSICSINHISDVQKSPPHFLTHCSGMSENS